MAEPLTSAQRVQYSLDTFLANEVRHRSGTFRRDSYPSLRPCTEIWSLIC